MGGLIVVSLGVVGASFPLGAQALEQARRDVVTRAVGYVDQIIAPVVEGRSSSGRFSNGETVALRSRIAEGINGDEVESIMLWSKSGGFLLFSTAGVGPRTRAPVEVRSAARGSVESSLSGRADRRLLATFVPTPAGTDPSAVAQVVQRYAPIEARVEDSWNTIRIGAGGAAALFLALLLLSRARSTRERAGDRGFASSNNDREARTLTPASAKVEGKLAKAEEARAALEEQLGQLRTQTAAAEARSAERAAVFGVQITAAEARVKELEGLLRESEARASQVAREAPFADAVAERDRSHGGNAELERELAETRSQLKASRSRLEELEPLLALSAARVEDVEARATRGARVADARAQKAEAKADGHERRLQVAETRVIELETYIADAEKRLAASATAAEESALRIRELQGQLEGARHDGEAALRQAEQARARSEDVSEAEDSGSTETQGSDRRADLIEAQMREMEGRAAQLEEIARSAEERAATARLEADDAVGALRQQLAEAHRAGKDAFRLVAEVRADLERTTAELERTRAELDAERARKTEPEEVASGNGRAERPESTDQEATTPADEPPDEGRGPSLRFRLAHSAAQRKGKRDRDEMWSPQT